MNLMTIGTDILLLQLYHAICAIGLLSLALKGQQQLLPEAFQHYHQAISSSLTSPSDLNSDRLLYLHFLLLVYDICYATQGPNDSQDVFNTNMWVQHIHHLLRIAQNREGRASGELQAYLMWYVLYLDAQACLSGAGSGDFVRAYVNNEFLLPDWRELRDRTQSLPMHPAYPNDENTAFAAVYNFSNGTCRLGSRLAILSHRLRAETAMQGELGLDAQTIAVCQAQISHLRNEYYAVWNSEYPSFLAQDTPHAGAHLPMLARVAFEFVSTIFYLVAFVASADTL